MTRPVQPAPRPFPDQAEGRSTIAPTIRRTTGNTINSTGKAITQDSPHAPIHALGKASEKPRLRAVAIAETTKVIMTDRISAETSPA